ncbi:MAG: hypothetical protein GQ574_24865 [Crocinitomix sp.]|nr:hypothetical protein [Crocinitomix sp.]
MKKTLLFNALMLFAIFSVKAQQFQESYTNSMGYSCDHYSIESFTGDNSQAYACAGTFFTSGG